MEHTDSVLAFTVLENGYLVSGSADRTIKIWNVEDGSVINQFNGHTHWVNVLVVLNNGDLVSGSSDFTIKIWDVETGTVKKDIQALIFESGINSLEVLENGDLISASSRSIKLWD